MMQPTMLPTYPRGERPPDSLVVVDLARDSMEGQIAACTLQGLINRAGGPMAYVLNTACEDNNGGGATQVQMAGRWLKEIFGDVPAETLAPAPRPRDPGFWALWARFRDHARGMVIYDPRLEQATIEAATTIAGQLDGIVASPRLAEALVADGCSVLADLREHVFADNVACLHWLMDNYFAAANHAVAFTWSHITTDDSSWGAANKDYVIAHRLFTFYLDITDPEQATHYIDVLGLYPLGTPVLGWTDELWADNLFYRLGYFMIPLISVENLTVHSAFPPAEPISIPAARAHSVEENAVYVAFHIPDGDNLLHSLVYVPNTILTSADFGAVPTTWVVNPLLVDLAPRAFAWLVARAAAEGQELAAMMGDGHPSSERAAGFRVYCDLMRRFLDKSGISTVKQMVEAEVIAWRVQPDAMIGGYAGTDWRGIGPYEYHLDGATFHVGSCHISEHDLAAIVRASPAEQPLFLSVFAGTARGDAPRVIREAAAALEIACPDRRIICLTTRDLAATYRVWRQQENG